MGMVSFFLSFLLFFFLARKRTTGRISSRTTNDLCILFILFMKIIGQVCRLQIFMQIRVFVEIIK